MNKVEMLPSLVCRSRAMAMEKCEDKGAVSGVDAAMKVSVDVLLQGATVSGSS
jgi:hypothetical protein